MFLWLYRFGGVDASRLPASLPPWMPAFAGMTEGSADRAILHALQRGAGTGGAAGGAQEHEG